MSDREETSRYVFVIYEPAGPGLPWLAVCIAPDGTLKAATACTSLGEAQTRTTQTAEDFMRTLANKHGLHDPSASLH